jgi:hypothetical protein
MAKFASMWYGPMTRLERLSVNSFINNGHEHHIFLYDMSNADRLPKEAIIHDANDVMPESEVFKDIYKNEYFQFADIFRLKMMKKYDYIWSDLDVICLSPDWKWDKMFIPISPKKPDEFPSRIMLNNSLFYIPSNSLFLDEMISITDKFNHKTTTDAYMLAMRLFTEMFISNKVNNSIVRKHLIPPNVIYPIHYRDIEKIYIAKEIFVCDFLTRNSFGIHVWRDTLKSSKSVSNNTERLIDSEPEKGSWLYNIYQKHLPYSSHLEWQNL